MYVFIRKAIQHRCASTDIHLQRPGHLLDRLFAHWNSVSRSTDARCRKISRSRSRPSTALVQRGSFDLRPQTAERFAMRPLSAGGLYSSMASCEGARDSQGGHVWAVPGEHARQEAVVSRPRPQSCHGVHGHERGNRQGAQRQRTRPTTSTDKFLSGCREASKFERGFTQRSTPRSSLGISSVWEHSYSSQRSTRISRSDCLGEDAPLSHHSSPRLVKICLPVTGLSVKGCLTRDELKMRTRERFVD